MHYLPALSAFISRFGGSDGGAALEDARELNDKIFGQKEPSQWQLLYVHAAVRSWWLAEYSSWYGEHYEGSLTSSQLDEGYFQMSSIRLLLLTILCREQSSFKTFHRSLKGWRFRLPPVLVCGC